MEPPEGAAKLPDTVPAVSTSKPHRANRLAPAGMVKVTVTRRGPAASGANQRPMRRETIAKDDRIRCALNRIPPSTQYLEATRERGPGERTPCTRHRPRGASPRSPPAIAPIGYRGGAGHEAHAAFERSHRM